MRGRKPKPLELRVIHGDAARRRAEENHPQPRRVLPRCPEHLTGEAAKAWKRLARDLYDAGLLTTVDRDALATYCIVYARWVDAEAKVSAVGPVIKTEAGNLIQNPYLSVANRALEQMGKLEAEFGMTPSSRSRVKAEISEARKQLAAQRNERQRQPEASDKKADDEDPRKALMG